MWPGGWLEIGVWIAIWAALGSALLWWSSLSHPWRQVLAFASSVAGLALLLVALNTEGQREILTTTMVLTTPYATRITSASASSAYYVLTGVCLLLGALGLSLSVQRVERLARRVLAPCLALATGVAVLRLVLEQAAAPGFLSRIFGVTWLAPVVGAYVLVKLQGAGQGWRRVLSALTAFALLSRVPVLLIYVAASVLELGSHYDVTPLAVVHQPFTGHVRAFVPGSLDQLVALAIAPQLLFWTPITWILALAGAALASFVRPLLGPSPSPAAPAQARSLASQGQP